MIELRQVSKRFDDTIIFENVNLKIEHAGIHVILGKSGSGKSTFLNMLAGYESISSGEIKREGNIASIFQNYELITELTVRDNIYIAQEIRRVHVDNSEEIIKMLGLQELLDHYPDELSGGQKQRVGIARALFQRPDIILCDEPTESLDVENKQMIMNLFKRLSEDHIILMATHDQKIVEQYADRIYRIKDKMIQVEEIYEVSQIKKETIQYDVDNKPIKLYLKKIIKRSTILFSILISLFTVLNITLYKFEKKLFQPFSSSESVTKDHIYIHSQYEGYDFNELGLNTKPLVEFNSLTYEKENYRFLIVPYIENEFDIKGDRPKDFEVMINQNVAKRLGEDCIGKNITLKYRIDSRNRSIEMTISGIVYENDIDREVIYYDENSFHTVLYEQVDENGMNDLDKLKNEARYYVVSTEYGHIDDIYDILNSNIKFMFESPLYDERIKEEREKQLYQVVFMILEVLVLTGIIITIIIYNRIDTKKYMKNCSIFIVLGANYKQVKEIYFRTKLFIFTLIYFSMIYSQKIIFSILVDYQLRPNEYDILNIAIISIYTIYLVVLFVSLRSLRIEKINALLKDHDE